MILIWLPLFVAALDRVTKMYVQAHWELGESLPLIQNFFHLTYIQNHGAAFGMLHGARFFFLGVALVCMAAAFYFRRDILQRDAWTRWGAGLFLGGTLGNVWDRAQLGYVIDFFDFRVWPVFNVADIAICVGVAFIIWSLWQQERAEGKRNAH